jgi:hypothetical protein
MSAIGLFQQLGTRVNGGGGLLQQVSEKVAPLVHAFCGRIVFGGFDVNRLVADGAIVRCLSGTGKAVPQRGSLFGDSQRQWSDGHNGILLLASGLTIAVESHIGSQLSEVADRKFRRLSQAFSRSDE